MNYEKILKEALNSKATPFEVSSWIEEQLPELAKSEDEKIRHYLMNFVKINDGVNLPPDYAKKALAWLERQGEHANFRDKIQVGDKVTRNEDGILVNLSQLKRVAKPREKQCEQKPEMKTAEESLGIDSDTYNKIVDECIFGEQKKEENKGNLGGISANSEWSEEDVFRTETLISVIKSGGSIRPELRNEFVNWLKSLRPQNRWKPSDEQIKVCKEVYADILSAKGFDLGTVVSELNRMEEQLKKLKEK